MQELDLLKQFVRPKHILLIWRSLEMQLRKEGRRTTEKGGNARHVADTSERHYATMTEAPNSRQGGSFRNGPVLYATTQRTGEHQ
jgi:hypothetical protein